MYSSTSENTESLYTYTSLYMYVLPVYSTLHLFKDHTLVHHTGPVTHHNDSTARWLIPLLV